MQLLSLRVVDWSAIVNLLKRGLLGMATKEDFSKVFIPKNSLDSANVAYFNQHGKLMTKEKIAEIALEFFTKFYKEKYDVAKLNQSVKKK